jgi:chromosome segregation ATPase
MSRAWAFVYSIALGISLFASDMAFQPGALAQTGGLDPAKISEFQAKLESAQRTQADINRRVMCMSQREPQLISQRDDLDLRIGSLRAKEKTLAPNVKAAEDSYRGYMDTYETERSNVDKFRRHREEVEARKRGQEQALRECKAKWYTINASCDAAYSLLEVVGEIKNYDGDIAAAARREQIANDSANFALTNLEQSKQDFDSTRKLADALAADLKQTEHEMGATKIALSGLRAELQPNTNLIGQFANALEEAKDVNLADARARTLRALAEIARKIDAAMVDSTAAVRRADENLGAEWMKSCRVN